jgi:hypothetical protein
MRSSFRRAPRNLGVTLALSAFAAACTLTVPQEAHAARELMVPAGERGTLAIDQVSGFRASMINGISYAGPLGFSHAQYTEHSFSANTDTTTNRNTFWLTPSADLFVIDHLSVGLLVEYMNSWGSVDIPRNNNTTQTVNLPGTTSITVLPRVGYLFSINDRFAIWPRVGFGYARHETLTGNPDNSVKDAFSSVLFDIDVGLLYRFNETFFMRADPDFVFTLGGNHSQSTGAGSVSASANAIQASAVFGVGVFFDLY